MAPDCPIRRVGTLDNPALARHHGVANSEVSPSCGHHKIVASHVVSVRRCGHGDCGNLRTQYALRDTRDGRLRIEQPRQLATSRR